MGALAEQGAVPARIAAGDGQRLIDWWAQADDEDRALFRHWAEIVDPGRGRMRVPAHVIAEQLTAAESQSKPGWTISPGTVAAGIRRLRSTEWAS